MAQQQTNLEVAVSLPPLHSAQEPIWGEIERDQIRFVVLACGRRWGKTFFGVRWALQVAILGGRAWWVAPVFRIANEGWRVLSSLAEQIPGVEILRGQGRRQVTLPAGGSVEIRSADHPWHLRGAGLDLVVLDEFPYMNEEVWTYSIRPALSDKQGSCLFIGTPAGRNLFYELFLLGQQGEAGWRSWQRATETNPYIAKEEIEAARRDMPSDVFSQEYLAEFLGGRGAVFQNILANMVAPEADPQEHEDHLKVAGLDWAQREDYTALSVVCVDCMREIHRLRLTQLNYSWQRQVIVDAYQEWGISYILAEANAIGLPNIESLREANLNVREFWTETRSKAQLIRNLQLCLEREEIAWQPDPIWTAEIESYQQSVSKTTARPSYFAPRGRHDDTVVARALAARAAMQPLAADLVAFV